RRIGAQPDAGKAQVAQLIAGIVIGAHRRADLSVTWVRRTRFGGDEWVYGDISLGEENETYQLRVMVGGLVRRQEFLSVPSWHYSAAEQAADGVGGLFELRVSQVSQRYGPGLEARVLVTP
ncbi:MAG: hypothetical protein AAF891_10440, partial [Pseudomonadota bacterium]